MDGEDLLAKFDAMTKRFKAEFEEIIEGERAKMKAEVDAYNVEKERMKAVTVKDDDIIHLNVGGKKMTTERSTLCQVEGSLLASMFSGRWEDSLKRDKDGCVFIDFNPQYFGLILDYLRAKRVETPENPAPLPKVASEQLKNFNNLVGYLGLKEELVPNEELVPKGIIKESFKQHSTEITIEENGAVASRAPTQGYKYVLGENTYQDGVMRWQLKLESFQNSNWMFVGIVKADTVPSNDNSYGWPGTYGWTLGGGHAWTKGQPSTLASLKNTCKQGDTVELLLDCTTSKLSLVFPAKQEFHLTLPSSTAWKLHINLHGANDKIRIL